MGGFKLSFEKPKSVQYPTEETYNKILRKGVSINNWCVDIMAHKTGTGTGMQQGRVYIDDESLMNKRRACMALGEAVYDVLIRTKVRRGE